MTAFATDPEAATWPARATTLPPIDERCVGPYELCLELASGGMATVFLAQTQAGSSRSFVALKVIHHHLAFDPVFVEMFRDEAHIASQIRHANVCSVFDSGSDGEKHYLAMEFLAGESLAAVWRKISEQEEASPGPELARRVARVLSDACEGLHAAHELTDASGEPLRIVHRDVSPENIMLTHDGVAKILDFGVASAKTQHHLTRSGMLKGKFSYIAPELLRGQKADRRVDVWGMGATAWELLTGKRLFRSDTDIETLRAIVEAPIAPPSHYRPDLPPAMDEVVMRALSRDPAERYQTARDFGNAMLRASVSDGEVTGLGDLSEWMQRLFPTGRQRNRDLLELVGKVRSTVPRLSGERRRFSRSFAPTMEVAPDSPRFESMRTDVARQDSARPDSVRPDSARPDSARRDSVRPDSARPDSRRRDDGGLLLTATWGGSAPARPSDRPPAPERSHSWERTVARVALPLLALLGGLFLGHWLTDAWGARRARDAAESRDALAAAPAAVLPPPAAASTVLADGMLLGEPYVVRVERDGHQLVLRVESRTPEVRRPEVVAHGEDP